MQILVWNKDFPNIQNLTITIIIYFCYEYFYFNKIFNKIMLCFEERKRKKNKFSSRNNSYFY